MQIFKSLTGDKFIIVNNNRVIQEFDDPVKAGDWVKTLKIDSELSTIIFNATNDYFREKNYDHDCEVIVKSTMHNNDFVSLNATIKDKQD